MVLGWVFLIRGDDDWIVLAYRMDCIVSAGSYRIVWIISYWLNCIVSVGSYQETLAFMLWLVNGWMGRLGQMEWMRPWWDGVGMDQYYQAPEGGHHHWPQTGAPPLDLEGRQDVGSGG